MCHFLGENFKNILIIDLAYIGDLLMATPAISEIKRAFPAARVTVLCSPSSSDVLLRNPDIDEILTFEKENAGFWKLKGFASKLRRGKYEIAFIFHRAFGSALLALVAGIKRRVGFSTEGRSLLLSHPVKLDKTKHRADNDLVVLKSYGLDINPDAGLVYITDPADEGFLDKVLGKDVVGKGYIVLNPNGSWDTKRWPVERFRALSERIRNELGLIPVGIGSDGETRRVGEMLGGSGFNLAGKTDLSKLGVLCRDAVAVVTNDSGPMHIAAAAGADVIAIFGPTSPSRCGPRSDKAVVLRSDKLDCIGCYKKKCPLEFECMLELSVDEVFEVVVEKTGSKI